MFLLGYVALAMYDATVAAWEEMDRQQRRRGATDNHDIGIQLDGSGGVGTGNVASFNGSHGIWSPNATVTANTAVRNVGFGISAVCPSTIISNTIVSNTAGSITTNGAGCVLANNGTRP